MRTIEKRLFRVPATIPTDRYDRVEYHGAVALDIKATRKTVGPEKRVTIRSHDASEHISSFEGVTLSETREGNEILPIADSDNYVTIYPGETAETHGAIWKDDNPC